MTNVEHETTKGSHLGRKADILWTFSITALDPPLQNIDWSEFFKSKNINELNEIFVDKVGSILREVAPLKTHQIRRNFSNWLDDEIKDKMNDRNMKRELARTSGDPAHWKIYRTSRNICTKELRKLKIKYYREMYKKYEKDNDTKSIYRTTKKLLNFNSGGSPQCFLIDGNPLRRPVDLANVQMNFFVEKVRKLSRGLVNNGVNPLKWLQDAMARWHFNGKFQKFHFQEITLQETLNLIRKLGNTSSLGTDEIDAIAIKSVSVHLAPPIRHLINTSLQTSKFANKWKIAKLVPLLKSKDMNRMLPEAYRPIAILPALSKLVEKAAQSQLLGYLEHHNLLNNNLHAYREGLGTTTTMIEITERLFKAVDEGKISSIMTIDQSVAFDCVPFGLLLDKLKLYNLDDSAVSWVESYLTFRTQFVAIGSARSRMCPVEIGVPLGYVLGPLLFSLFTNEMTQVIMDQDCRDPTHLDTMKLFNPECSICGSLTIYADDVTYHVSNKQR